MSMTKDGMELSRNSSLPDEQVLPTSSVAATGPEAGGVLH